MRRRNLICRPASRGDLKEDIFRWQPFPSPTFQMVERQAPRAQEGSVDLVHHAPQPPASRRHRSLSLFKAGGQERLYFTVFQRWRCPKNEPPERKSRLLKQYILEALNSPLANLLESRDKLNFSTWDQLRKQPHLFLE